MNIPKGTRDFLPEEKIIRDQLISKFKEVFELYGYNPLETPSLELYETLSRKDGAGEESDSMKEVYTLEDNAGRKLALRFDQTVPLARVMAMNPEIKKPFKRYEIGKTWRDGPIKLGRYREFLQCDVDVVGIKSVLAEAELFSLVQKFFEKINLKIKMFVNNRKLINSMMDYAGVPKDSQSSAIISMDKLDKIGINGVRKEFEEKKIADDAIAKLLSLLDFNGGTNEEILEKLGSVLKDKEGINELKELFSYTKEFKIKNLNLNISLARGFSYYTGSIFEVFVDNETINSSLAGGGRFDEMVGRFMDSKTEVPAVGIAFGLDVIIDTLRLNNKLGRKKSVVEAYIIPIKKTMESIPILNELREAGINADMDLSGKSVGKNIDFVDKLNIPYSIFVGENELKSKKVKLKNMQTGEEKELSLKEVISTIKDDSK